MPALSGHQHPALPKAAAPVHAARFDPWNSSSTGHQRGDRRPGTAWRDARARRVNAQFREGRHHDDDAGDDGRGDGAVVVAGGKQRSVADMLARPGLMRRTLATGHGGSEPPPTATTITVSGREAVASSSAAGTDGRRRQQAPPDGATTTTDARDGSISISISNSGSGSGSGSLSGGSISGGSGGSGILAGVVAYVNGSTYPLVSDHRLRQLLAEHGASMSLHLGRRRVTHVILGRPASAGRGAGGGLAGGKLEREIRRVAGCGVKFVGVEWILESIKAGKRLPEARFVTLKIAPQAQASVYGLFSARGTAAGSTTGP
ncbi:60S ribosomal protein L10 [Purpureocillium lavendulum]|uniref:60S ribosomal protein L10 n=1 Tax=Purpureocillium lavendulum TaxID=1247861 RepID=A0AB34FNE1_9HYPO|nr:60S ribosomal protein L10 [Purpureocillium lavendulum]